MGSNWISSPDCRRSAAVTGIRSRNANLRAGTMPPCRFVLGDRICGQEPTLIETQDGLKLQQKDVEAIGCLLVEAIAIDGLADEANG